MEAGREEEVRRWESRMQVGGRKGGKERNSSKVVGCGALLILSIL